MNKDVMATYGIDCEKGLQNCLENEAFYKKILTMFLQDSCFAQAEQAYAASDTKTLFSRMHELKGISGNAGLPALYDAVVPLVQLLRSGAADPAEVTPLFRTAEAAYSRACEGIRLLIAE